MCNLFFLQPQLQLLTFCLLLLPLDLCFNLQPLLFNVRCCLPTGTVDLINFYQCTTGVTHHRTEPMKARANLWVLLCKVLQSLPVRNTLLLGGDFNTSLSTKRGTVEPDVSCLRNLLHDFGLINLRSRQAIPSFVGPQGSSTIDYLFMRKIQSDCKASGALCLDQFPLIQDRDFPDHRPLLCSFPVDWGTARADHRWTIHVSSHQTPAPGHGS